jgi:hypothetical protein
MLKGGGSQPKRLALGLGKRAAMAKGRCLTNVGHKRAVWVKSSKSKAGTVDYAVEVARLQLGPTSLEQVVAWPKVLMECLFRGPGSDERRGRFPPAGSNVVFGTARIFEARWQPPGSPGPG